MHHPLRDADQIRELFRSAGLRCTRQREIYTALAASRLHPTAEDLHQQVMAEDPGLSLATVYNTLDAFTEAGLAQRVSDTTAAGPARFDADMSQHAHLVETGGGITDLPADLNDRLHASLDPALLTEIESRLGVRVRGLRVQIAVERDGHRSDNGE